MLMRVVTVLVGTFLVLLIAHALVVDLLVPRPASSLLTRATRSTMQALISLVAASGRPYPRQHRQLAALGPLILVATLFLAVVGFLIGFALILYGVTQRPLMEVLLQSGSGLLTLGIVQIDDPAQIMITFLAAFTGMVIIAVLIGYLLLLFTAYTSREKGVTKSAVWAGEPAWGPELLCRRELGDFGRMDPLTEGWIDWVCEVRVAQTMYPTLSYFRSSGSTRGWVTALLSRMDAAALELAVVADRKEGPLTSFLAEGGQTFGVMRVMLEPSRATKMVRKPPTIPSIHGVTARSVALFRAIDSDGARARSVWLRHPEERTCTLPRAEFDRAVALLEGAGIGLVPDRDAAWERFSRLRSEYEADAYRVAYRVHSPPAPWSGPRRRPVPTVWPTSAVELLHGTP